MHRDSEKWDADRTAGSSHEHYPGPGPDLRTWYGVRGAAIATVISQGASALWVFVFLTGKKALFRLTPESMKLKASLVKDITFLGTSGFVMSVTNGTVQIVCNAVLARYGGDLYVGIMTVINSVRRSQPCL